MASVRVFLLHLVLIGLYTQFHLYRGSTILFPFVLPNLIGAFVFVSYISRYNVRPSLSILGAIAIFSIGYLIAALVGGYFGQAMSKFVQLVVSIFSGFGIAILITRIGPDRLRRILLRLSVGILITAIAEAYLGFYPIMLKINEVLYAWRPAGFYIDAGRDVANWGAVRPLVFSTEPSLVGIWGSVLMIGATMLSTAQDWKRYAILIAYVVVLLFVTRSTTSMVILISHLVATLFDRRFSLSKQLVVLGVAIAMTIVLTLSSAATLVGQYAEGTSFFARILGPYMTTIEVLRINPIFGLGLGNENALETIIMDVWNRTGMLAASMHYIKQWGITGMLTNNFFLLWIYFGVVGGLIFLGIVFALVRQLGRYPMVMVALTSFGVWMTVGGFVDARSWFFVYFFISCAILSERTIARER